MSDFPDYAMKTEQLSVFLENRAGRLGEIINLLSEHGIDIRGISLADTSDFGILRLMVNDIGRTEELLNNRGFTTGKTNVVAVEIPDTPGSLANILNHLSRENINVEYMYAYARRDVDKAIMVFRFDKLDEAIAVLMKKNLGILAEKELLKI